jgi:mono/diheme cytochrome c family protein
VLCYGCHGEDGLGAVVPGVEPKRVTPQLNREQFWVTPAEDPDVYKQNYELVNKTIHRGRNQIMPAWGLEEGGTLNDEQIHELTVMILNGDRKPNLPRDPHFNGQHTTWEVTEEIVQEHIAAGAPTPIPVSEAAPPLPPELQAGRQVFEAKGCIGCHVIQGVGGAVGPDLTTIGTTAESRVPGESAEEYIRESILNSTAFVVPNYPPVMPSFQGNITDQELNDLVRYLMSLK